MNPTKTPSTSTSGSTGGSSTQRKERGAIAAQACDTCRSRKQRCDEARPKCGLCSRMKLECNYHEPQPTKKDKTLTDILARLTAIEEKLIVLPMPGPGRLGYGPSNPSPPSQHSYKEMPQQSSYPSQLSQQLDQTPMEPSPPLPPIRSVGGNGGDGGNGGNGSSNNLFEFQGDVWAYVQALENQIRELQARLETVEREKDNLVGQLTGQSGKMDMS